jgi:putative endonuclease
MSYYVYVIKSFKGSTRYVGTTQNIQKRLKEHNQGQQRYTKGHRPWKLVYQERFPSRSAAMKQERFYKTTTGRRQLDILIKQYYE